MSDAASEPIPARSGNEQATQTSSTKAAMQPAPLEPGDFYYENGLMVFTAAYHLKRGYCCNSSCRHCPFR
jgi:hypothetical protein